MGRPRQARNREMKLVDALKDGWKLFYEVGQSHSSCGSYFSLGVYSQAFMRRGEKAKSASKDSVKRLVDRGVLRHDGEWPRQNCFDSTTRTVELFLIET